MPLSFHQPLWGISTTPLAPMYCPITLLSCLAGSLGGWFSEELLNSQTVSPRDVCFLWAIAGTHFKPHFPLFSPEKEAFKKRQKLLQDNGEETDENEVEEVREVVGFLFAKVGGLWLPAHWPTTLMTFSSSCLVESPGTPLGGD